MLRRLMPCFFAILIDALGFGLVYPVMAAIFTATNSPVLSPDTAASLRHFYLGLSYMLYPLCMFFGASFMGDLSDNWGRKKVLLLCMAGITVSFGLMAAGVALKNLSLLFLGRALSGLMAGSQPIAQASIADLSTPENKARNMSFISLSYSFGSVLGPFVGGMMSDAALVSWFNFSTPFVVAAVLAGLSFLALQFKFEETSKAREHKKISILRPVHIFIEAYLHQGVRQLAIVFLLMQIGFSIYFQFIIIYMQSAYHYSSWQMGAFQGMLGVGFTIGLLIGMPIVVKCFTVRGIAWTTLLLTGLSQLLATIMPTALLQWILAIFIACVDAMAFSAILTLFSNAVDSKAQGWVMGISGAVMAIAWAVTGLASNFLNLFSVITLIAMGSVFLLVSAWLLFQYKAEEASAHVLS